MTEFDLGEGVVMITGGTRGIGLGIAKYLAELGASVVITGRKQERVDEASATLDRMGFDHLARALDVRDVEGTKALVADIVDEWGAISGLVANAQSFCPITPLAEVTEDDMDLLFDTGPKGTLIAMQAVLPHMAAAGWGRIVTMATSLGLTGAAGYGPYAASNEAIRSLTRTAANEWGSDGITVNCVLPASAGHRVDPSADPKRKAVFDAMYEDHPIGRDGHPEHDIAPAVAFLLSEASRYVTGQSISVDGGGVMRP